jgi:predicted enzyme related to lactoylglutathione lyase
LVRWPLTTRLNINRNKPVKRKYNIGTIVSADLTVENASQVKDFYVQVIGWAPEELRMGSNLGSTDYVMKDSGGDWAGGVCEAKGVNTGIPPQWIVYINVQNISESVEKCKGLGGKIIKEAFDSDGNHIYAMLQDPFGAILAVTHVSEEQSQ